MNNVTTIKNYLKNLVNRFVSHLKNNKKKILINYLIFLGVFAVFLLIDQLTKTFIFHHGDINTLDLNDTVIMPDGTRKPAESIYPYVSSEWTKFGLITIRSIWHRGVTLWENVNIVLIQVLSAIIFLVTLTSIMFLTEKKKRVYFYIVALAILSAGDMGNFLDRCLFKGHVKDWFFFNFIKDRGTLNLADSFIFIGICLFIITSFISIIMEITSKEKHQKENPTK